MNRWVMLMFLSALSAPALAREQFVEDLRPCLRLLQTPNAAPSYRIVLEQGWTAGLFAIAEKDGGGLGTDLCGELSNGGMAFAGSYVWPDRLGALKAVDTSLITSVWLERVIESARRGARADGLKIEKITVTALPSPRAHLVRVHFADRQGRKSSVDLTELGKVIPRDSRVPDQFERQTGSPAPRVVDKVAAPTVDPKRALKTLLSETKAGKNAIVLRLTLTGFSAGLVYRNSPTAAVRQTEFNHIDGEVSGLADNEFDFPAAFKGCAMRLDQVQSAVDDIVTQRRYKTYATRLHYLLLECSADKPKPHWSLTALEPFEYFDLSAEL